MFQALSVNRSEEDDNNDDIPLSDLYVSWDEEAQSGHRTDDSGVLERALNLLSAIWKAWVAAWVRLRDRTTVSSHRRWLLWLARVISVIVFVGQVLLTVRQIQLWPFVTPLWITWCVFMLPLIVGLHGKLYWLPFVLVTLLFRFGVYGAMHTVGCIPDCGTAYGVYVGLTGGIPPDAMFYTALAMSTFSDDENGPLSEGMFAQLLLVARGLAALVKVLHGWNDNTVWKVRVFLVLIFVIVLISLIMNTFIYRQLSLGEKLAYSLSDPRVFRKRRFKRFAGVVVDKGLMLAVTTSLITSARHEIWDFVVWWGAR